jgi:predicted acylesterase/phospholipase RssA
LSAAAKVVGMQALILSGGGAQAAYEVGVMSALLTGQSPATEYSALDPGVLVGTSAGSINAGLLLSSLSAGASAATKYMEEVWIQDIAGFPGKCSGGVYRLRADPLAVLNAACLLDHPMKSLSNIAADSVVLAQTAVTRGINFVMSSGDFERKALELIDLSALISTEPFVELIHQRIRLDEIRRSSWNLRIAATNWRTGAVRIFDKPEMTDAIGHRILLASSALPGLFPSVEIEGDLYVDGGIVMNTPLKPAIDSGADTLHIIYMDPDISRVPLPRVPSTTAVLSRSIEISFRTAITQDIQLATQINHGIAVFSGKEPWLDGTLLSSGHFLREAGKRIMEPEKALPRRPLTMHLYYPSGGLNAGWLSFDRNNIERLISRGREDAIHHDCGANHCVFPTS